MARNRDHRAKPAGTRRWLSALIATATGAATLMIPSTAHADPLADHASSQGFEIGAALAVDHLNNDSQFANLAATEFNASTAENTMKWESVQPSQGNFDWSGADQYIDFARNNGHAIRGHTLVWHSQLPSWVSNGNFSSSELTNVMENHIDAVAGRYSNDVKYWDVANEIFLGDGSWRQSVFYQTIGEDFVAQALRAANEADPDAKLYLNDYSIDGINAKSDAYYNLAQDLLAQGVPLDGIGLQAHLINGQVPGDMQQNIQRFVDLGLEVAITELDVRIDMPASDSELQQQAQDYREVFNNCLAVSGCVGVTVWGITDQYSWVPDTFDGQGAPLLFDNNYNPKPAYDAVHDVLDSGTNPDDTQAPTTPGQPSASNVGANSVDLSWSPSSDNVGVTEYAVYSGGSQVATTSSTSTTVTGLNPNTQYTFQVQASDAAGNTSSLSPGVTVTTEDGSTPPPTGDCEVSYNAANEWNNGFTGNIEITPGSSVSGWELQFDFPNGQQLTNGWSGDWSQSGSTVTVTNAPWNGNLAAGQSVSVGFNASHNGTNDEPSSFSLNGESCTVS
ncbi:endo-1,4-beta-xylanase [Salinactinospora qingdaonensis]|uniref:Beta-xylanase n=1 Tax=Salinactinospora qingdaonensis TaxID=702744 RepID=A0ABP7F9Y4_9ACTN